MQNKSELEEKSSLGNAGRILPPLSLSSFLSLRTWSLSVKKIFFFSGNGSLGVVSGGGRELKDARLPT